MFHTVSIDIATFQGDAIVNSLGFDGARFGIYSGTTRAILAACPEKEKLAEEIQKGFPDLKLGSAFLTASHGLPCRYIVHAATPYYYEDHDLSILKSCCLEALELAYQKGARSIMIPVLGAGGAGYPPDEAASAIRRECYRFALSHDDADIYLTVYALENDDEPLDSETAGSPRVHREESVHCKICSMPGAPGTKKPKKKKSKPRPPFIERIGMEFEDSFATLVRKTAFKKTKGGKAKKEAALDEVWCDINSMVRDFKDKDELFDENVRLVIAKDPYNKPNENLDTKGSTWNHAPSYEWRRQKCASGYVWQCPNKAEVLLSCVAMHLNAKETMEVYAFCGYSLSPYEKHDAAMAECVKRLDMNDPWTRILRTYRQITGESLMDYRKEREKRYVDGPEKW